MSWIADGPTVCMGGPEGPHYNRQEGPHYNRLV